MSALGGGGHFSLTPPNSNERHKNDENDDRKEYAGGNGERS